MGLLTPYSVPREGFFVHNDCPGGEGGFLLPSSRVPEGLFLDEIDTCIIY